MSSNTDGDSEDPMDPPRPPKKITPAREEEMPESGGKDTFNALHQFLMQATSPSLSPVTQQADSGEESDVDLQPLTPDFEDLKSTTDGLNPNASEELSTTQPTLPALSPQGPNGESPFPDLIPAPASTGIRETPENEEGLEDSQNLVCDIGLPEITAPAPEQEDLEEQWDLHTSEEEALRKGGLPVVTKPFIPPRPRRKERQRSALVNWDVSSWSGPSRNWRARGRKEISAVKAEAGDSLGEILLTSLVTFIFLSCSFSCLGIGMIASALIGFGARALYESPIMRTKLIEDASTFVECVTAHPESSSSISDADESLNKVEEP